jgi:hypothetical protein
MLRTFFGKKDEEENSIKMASTITFAEFKEALSRYPQVLKKISKPGSFPFFANYLSFPLVIR